MLGNSAVSKRDEIVKKAVDRGSIMWNGNPGYEGWFYRTPSYYVSDVETNTAQPCGALILLLIHISQREAL